MIVEVTVPNNVTKINYGAIQMLADENHKLQVPDYVAKTIAALPGCSCLADLSASVAALLNSGEEDFEARYLIWAHNRSVPLPVIEGEGEDAVVTMPDAKTLAADLLTSRGVPAASLV